MEVSKPAEKTEKTDEQTLAELNSAHAVLKPIVI